MSLWGIPIDYLRNPMRVGELVAALAAKGFHTFDVYGWPWPSIDETPTYNNFVRDLGIGPTAGTGDDDEWVWTASVIATDAERAAYAGVCQPNYQPLHAVINSSPTEPPVRLLYNNPAECVDISDAPIAAACSKSGDNHLSGYWAGEREERVEITTGAEIPAGNTVIAVASSRHAEGAYDRAVYDQRGNTYTADAQYAHAGDEYRVIIYRSVLTTALQANDWIRFAHRSDTLNVSVDTWARCIGAYAFSGALSVNAVGSGNSAFSSSPSLTTPAGGIVVAGIALEENNDITLDGDWTAMVPHTWVFGTGGGTTNGVAAQYVEDSAGDTWSASIDQSRVWAAISVGYTRS